MNLRVRRDEVARLTCAEVDPHLAEKLHGRHAGGNETVVNEDATAAGRTVRSTAPRGTRRFAEVARVLRPGGAFAGVASRNSKVFRALHPLDQVDLNAHALPFRARKTL